jgi:hypothetical protein
METPAEDGEGPEASDQSRIEEALGSLIAEETAKFVAAEVYRLGMEEVARYRETEPFKRMVEVMKRRERERTLRNLSCDDNVDASAESKPPSQGELPAPSDQSREHLQKILEKRKMEVNNLAVCDVETLLLVV